MCMRESFVKNRKGILLMLLSATCVCLGQFLWKISVGEGILYVIFGFELYGLGALLMLLAYKYGSLSVLQPMQSAGYILSLMIGHLILKENISLSQVIGVAVIFGGIILIAGGDA